MIVLLAIKGSEGEDFFRRAAALTALDRADRIILAHVIDTGPRGDLEIGRDRYLGRRALAPERAAELGQAEEERARAGLVHARQVLEAEGIAGDRLEEQVLRGKPNEALRDLAEREGVDLIVVAGRGGRPGPHSLGKTARFLVDHAPNAALLVRP